MEIEGNTIIVDGWRATLTGLGYDLHTPTRHPFGWAPTLQEALDKLKLEQARGLWR